MRWNGAGVILASQTVTVAGNSGALTLPSGGGISLDEIGLYFNITAVSGTTPGIVFSISAIDPVSGGVMAAALLTLASITAVGETRVVLSKFLATVANLVANTELPAKVQIAWTLSGTTPSFTFAINGEW